MSDHSVYLEKEQTLADIAQSPGFPYLRIHPALIDTSRLAEISSAEERLLLAMHLPGNQLLVISNRSAIVYQIPQFKQRSKLAAVGGVGLKIGIGMIPVVGELMDAGEKLWKPVEWIKAGREKKDDQKRWEEGLPSNEEIKSVAWDFNDQDTLILIQIYKEKILLKNGFKWQTLFQVSFDKPAEPVVVTVEEKGIRVKVGRKEAMTLYLDKSWEPLKIADILVQHNRQAFEAMGCSIEIGDQKFVFTKC
jgi:hypothetical protein